MYKKISLSFDQIPQLSSRDQAYQLGANALQGFYEHDVALSSFEEVVKVKKAQKINRNLIVRELEHQYADIIDKEKVEQHIKALGDEGTYTIITAHQPSLLTGPLYFIYKICSVISLTRQLNQHYSDFKVVPAFILGGEDHDFEEIATMRMFGQEFTWETDQKGSTGRMSLDGVDKVLGEVKERFGESTYAGDLRELIDQAFSASSTYGEFMFRLVHSLFGAHGLVILNMDNA
ncbi:MAG: bacillithiol biosynthesis BshC, partial [Saprospiraceae bacterium]|nr:bacillithiol biosynthesis BshC [Saprospiraceae bacterium]